MGDKSCRDVITFTCVEELLEVLLYFEDLLSLWSRSRSLSRSRSRYPSECRSRLDDVLVVAGGGEPCRVLSRFGLRLRLRLRARYSSRIDAVVLAPRLAEEVIFSLRGEISICFLLLTLRNGEGDLVLISVWILTPSFCVGKNSFIGSRRIFSKRRGDKSRLLNNPGLKFFKGSGMDRFGGVGDLESRWMTLLSCLLLREIVLESKILGGERLILRSLWGLDTLLEEWFDFSRSWNKLEKWNNAWWQRWPMNSWRIRRYVAWSADFVYQLDTRLELMTL